MLQDFFCDTLDQALAELNRRKSEPSTREYIHKVEPSPYGGYRVWSVDASVYADMIAEGIQLPTKARLKAGGFAA